MQLSPVRGSAAALITASLLLVAACGPAGGPPAAPPAAEKARAPVDVRLGRVEAGSLPRIVRASGTLDADETVTVAAEAAGRIVAVLHDVGDRVSTGDPLARVNDADYLLERDQRQRALTEVLARLGLDALPDGDVEFERLPSVERARLEAENAKAKLDRLEGLRNRTPPLISEQDYADARTAWEVAESGRRLALMNARADLATARTRRAEIDMSEKRLRDTLHVAPSGGRPGDAAGAAKPNVFLVAERLVAVGDRVAIGAPLFRLVDPDPLRLRVQVPERRMAGVTVGRTASIATAASKEPVTGTVARIRPEVDPRTRTVDVEIAVANGQLQLATGSFATAEIDVGLDTGVPMAPESAVRSFAGVRKVFVVSDGKAAEKVVVVGRKAAGRVEILSGVKVGDEVVLDAPAELVAGSPVRVTTAPPAAEGK